MPTNMTHQYTKTYSTTDEEFIQAIKDSFTIREALLKIGLAPAGGNYKTFHMRVKQLQLDLSHFLGQGHLKGKKHSWGNKISLQELLVKDSKRVLFSNQKSRIIDAGLLVNECAGCKLKDSWNGKKIVLHLDHINGDHFDHRIENLRFLCPNCHSQTETYCSSVRNDSFKETKKHPAKISSMPKCALCSVQLKKRNKYCATCYDGNRATLQPQRLFKIQWPSIEDLKSKLETMSYVQLAKELGVSDNSVRKHIKNNS